MEKINKSQWVDKLCKDHPDILRDDCDKYSIITSQGYLITDCDGKKVIALIKWACIPEYVFYINDDGRLDYNSTEVDKYDDYDQDIERWKNMRNYASFEQFVLNQIQYLNEIERKKRIEYHNAQVEAMLKNI